MMTNTIRARLWVMMFLQFFIWGGWFVTLGTYLGNIGFTGTQVGNTYLMNNLAAIISPFLVGMIADRFFNSEKVMGVLHLLGALLLFWASGIKDSPGLFIVVLLLYNVCYMPTLALVNTISFNQMEHPNKEFPVIRVLGTVGWIVAGLTITFVLGRFVPSVEATAVPMKMAATVSLLLGLYSFTLPATPPRMKDEDVTVRDILGLKAINLMKEASFSVFVVCSLLISIPLAFYYAFTNPFLNDIGMTGVVAKQTMGQMSEVIFMVLMPFFFVRLGVKKMLLVGMLAWVLRYALFALGDAGSTVWMLYGALLLHGVCYDFFFVTGQIYVDRKADRDTRASAQGFITLVTYGVGIGLGSVISGVVLDLFTREGVRHWTSFWWVPCIFAGIVAVLFTLVFRDRSADDADAVKAS